MARIHRGGYPPWGFVVCHREGRFPQGAVNDNVHFRGPYPEFPISRHLTSKAREIKNRFTGPVELSSFPEERSAIWLIFLAHVQNFPFPCTRLPKLLGPVFPIFWLRCYIMEKHADANPRSIFFIPPHPHPMLDEQPPPVFAVPRTNIGWGWGGRGLAFGQILLRAVVNGFRFCWF